MNGCVELCVYFDYKPAEVRQTSGLRYASPSNKKNFSARMGEKQTRSGIAAAPASET